MLDFLDVVYLDYIALTDMISKSTPLMRDEFR